MFLQVSRCAGFVRLYLSCTAFNLTGILWIQSVEDLSSSAPVGSVLALQNHLLDRGHGLSAACK